MTKNRRPRPQNSLRLTDNRKHFWVFFWHKIQGKVHMIQFATEMGEIWRWSCWEKWNFILIYEFKYCQTWNIWPSPLSLGLYHTFNMCCMLISLLQKYISLSRLPPYKHRSSLSTTIYFNVNLLWQIIIERLLTMWCVVQFGIICTI